MITIRCRVFGHDPNSDPRSTCRRCGHQRHPGHAWDVLDIVTEEGIPRQWARRDIRCKCCGEERRVFWGLDPETILDHCPKR